MAHSEKCPVCNGKGKVKKEQQCHGCLGLGWVTVQDQFPVIQPVYPGVPWSEPYQPWQPIYPGWDGTTYTITIDGRGLADTIVELYNNGHEGLNTIIH